MDLIENNQFACVTGELAGGVGQPAAIFLVSQFEIYGCGIRTLFRVLLFAPYRLHIANKPIPASVATRHYLKLLKFHCGRSACRSVPGRARNTPSNSGRVYPVGKSF